MYRDGLEASEHKRFVSTLSWQDICVWHSTRFSIQSFEHALEALLRQDIHVWIFKRGRLLLYQTFSIRCLSVNKGSPGLL